MILDTIRSFSIKTRGAFLFEVVVGGWTKLCKTDPGLVEKNTWHQITLTCDEKKFKISVDGKLVKATDYQKTTGKITEFRFGVSGGETYVGLVDDVAFYKRALGEDEIKSITKSGMEAFLTVESKSKLALGWTTIKTE